MPGIASISRSQLSNRRKKLRQQRRWRIIQSGWRLLAVAGMAGGLIWVITLPAWVLRQPEQVEIDGNHLLSATTVQSLLPIDYPQSILELQPEAIATQLEAQAPIAHAVVTRRLLPPGLRVQIQERNPVAIALANQATAFVGSDRSQTAAASRSDSSQVGLIDEKGILIPIESYTSLDQSFQLPTLKVIGMREEYQSYWPDLYETILRSPIQIQEIDWRDPANLTLQTSLGVVHFGAYDRSQFPKQLQILDQMRQFPQDLDSGRLEYIDLRNPNSPVLQMK